MLDRSFLYSFVVAHESGKDRQARCIGRCPARWPDLVLFQIPNRAAPRFPSTVLVGKGVEQLVQCPCIAVEDKHVSIAVPIGATFNGRVARDWVGARIAFFGVFEDDRHFLLVARDNHVRNADRHALPIAAEIRVKRFVEPDPGEDRVGIRIDRRAGDILVPRTVVRQEPSAAEICGRSEFHARLVPGDRYANGECASEKRNEGKPGHITS